MHDPALGSGLRLCRGPRAAEAALLDDLAALVAATRWSDLDRPLRVLVPSRQLRRHLAAALMRRLGRPAAGVSFHTLRGLALEVLTRAGEPLPRGAILFDLLVPRLARREPALRRCLDDLEDGYAAVAGTVRDLMDAGCEPVHAEAAAEVLAGGGEARQRALALLRVTAAAANELAELDAGTPWRLLRRAQELLAAAPVLPTRAVLVYGFADATGVATDLIETLLYRCGGRCYLDHPPDPALPAASEHAFTQRFAERLHGSLPQLPADPGAVPPPALDAFAAAGTEAEVAELARRLQRLLASGVAPEGVAVVARDLERYRLPLGRQLLRLGIPFSTAARGALDPAGRLVRALLELLDRGAELPVERWLQLAAAPPALRSACAALGAGRLGEVAELSAGDLPVGELLAALPAAAPQLSSRLPAAARQLCSRLADAPATAAAERHLDWLDELLRCELEWGAARPEVAPVLAALTALRAQLPAGWPLERRELRPLLARALAEVGHGELGGKGGGVQVLGVSTARGLTCEHLFLLGLNRDLFPRTVREDPLLPDELRLPLLGVLPDLAIKARSFDEERYLFAQLLASAPRITLSWQVADDDDRPAARSPLLERLRRSGVLPPEERAPALAVRLDAAASDLPRPAFDHALEVALHGRREDLRAHLALALEAGAPPAQLAPARHAAVLLRVLDELDPDRRTPTGRARSRELGPYFGFVGPAAADDHRPQRLSVTLLEHFAACPWQTLLQRQLRLEPPPDPLQTLPGLTPVLVGRVVHGVLEAVVRRALKLFPQRLARLPGRRARPVRWPSPARLEWLLAKVAAQVLAEAGIRLGGLSRALVSRARPFLETIRQLEWPVPLAVLGAEVRGELTLATATGKRALSFRADRVDALPGGGLLLTDYKTGSPGATLRTPAGRLRAFQREVAQGRRLQAVAYLLAAQQIGSAAEGRYLYLRPDLEPDARQLSTAGAEPELIAAFETTAHHLLQAWDQGTFFPRLVQPDDDVEPRRCASCTVAEACLRRDSGARQRLRQALAQPSTQPPSPEVEAMLGVWRLGGK